MRTQEEIFDQILRNSLKVETSEKFADNLMVKVSILAEKRRKQEVFKERILLFLPLCLVVLLITIIITLTPSTSIEQNSIYAQYVKNFIEIMNAILYSKSIMTIIAIATSLSLLFVIDLKLRIKKVSI